MSDFVLLIDDDELLRLGLRINLQQSGYRVSTAASAEEGLTQARSEMPDVVLLDIGLPGMNGFEALSRFKGLSDTPIIFVTARRLPNDQVLGLSLGADDYITKPFELDVLLARLQLAVRRARLRKDGSGMPTQTVIGELAFNLGSQRAFLKGRLLNLTPHEFGLLYTLASEPGRTFSIDELLIRVWGNEYAGEPQVVYVNIRALRQKVEEDPSNPRRIVSVRGFGYKFQSPEIHHAESTPSLCD